MKKVLSVLVAMACVLTMVGTAAAAFSNETLVQSIIKNDDSVEVSLDLGLASGLVPGATNVVLAAPGTVTLSDLGLTSWAGAQLGFGAVNFTGSTIDNWFATILPTAPGIDAGKALPMWNAWAGGMQNTLDTYDVAGKTVIPGSDATKPGYNMKWNQNGVVSGYFAAYNANPGIGYLTLGDLDTVGYVDMYLYHFSTNSLVAGPDGPYTGILRLSADGSTTWNPSAVPVPGAVLLFGTGLLGFFGIRRKKA